MSAAEKLKPKEQGERVISLLSSTSAKFPGFADRTLASNGYSVTRYATLDEILSSPELSRPGIVLLEIDDENDIQQAHIFLKTQELAMAHGRLKTIIFTSIKHQDVRTRFKNIPIADYLLHPLPDRTFIFKLDLQAKILTKVLETEAKRIDPSFDLHSTQQRRGKFNLKVIGPSPTRGKWQLINNAPQGKVRWRWVRSPTPSPDALELEVKKRDWQYEGNEPPRWDDKEQLWNMESDQPILEKIENGKKTFSSTSENWLAKDVFTVRAKIEKEIAVKHDNSQVFEKEKTLDTKEFSLKNEGEKKEMAAATSELPTESNITLDLSETKISSESNSSPSEKAAATDSMNYSKNTIESSIMDLRSVDKSAQESPPPSTQESNVVPLKKQNTRAAPVQDNSFEQKTKKELKVGKATTPDQASALREKFKNKDGDQQESDPPCSGKLKNKINPGSETSAHEIQDKRTTDRFDGVAINRHNMNSDAHQKIPSMKDRRTDGTTTASPEENHTENKDIETGSWRDKRDDGVRAVIKEMTDRRKNEDALPQQQEREVESVAKSPADTLTGAEKTEKTITSAPGPQGSEIESGSQAPEPSHKERKLKSNPRRNHHEKIHSSASGKEDSEDERSVGSTSSAEGNPDDTLQERRGHDSQKEEIRIANRPDQHSNREEKSLYHVVKERVHYFKTLEELGDDNSTWERVEIYRVYLGAGKKYYGINTIDEALPVWVYVGESAPEYIEALKSWKFFDNIPVKYEYLADLPTPVLDLLMDLRKREKARKIEEHRRKNLYTDVHGEESSIGKHDTAPPMEEKTGKIEPSPASIAPMPHSEAPKMSAPDAPPVEYIRVESFMDKIVGIFEKLFKSRR